MANNEGSDLIEAAINETLKPMEGHRDGDLLVEWAVVAYVTNPYIKGRDAYPVLYSNGQMPPHRIRGLLMTALETLGGFVREDEDE